MVEGTGDRSQCAWDEDLAGVGASFGASVRAGIGWAVSRFLDRFIGVIGQAAAGVAVWWSVRAWNGVR
jgi:hypothetical protein